MSQGQNIDRKDLKIQALLEKVASLTQSYENQVADLRVELTVSEQNVKELRDTISSIHNEPVPTTPPPVDVIEGEVVDAVVEENPQAD